MAGKSKRITGAVLGIPPWQSVNLDASGAVSLGQGSCACQFRIWQLLNEVEVIGTINPAFNGGPAAGSLLNYPYRFPPPAHTQAIAISLQGNSTAPVTPPYLQIDPNGTATLQGGIPVTTTVMSFHGFYSLDA